MFFFSICAVVVGYLIGSIPFGFLFTKMAKLDDIRKIGSGNIGATNVLRTGRKDLALLTLICDLGKAAIIAFIFQAFTHSQIIGIIAGIATVIGHNFPIYLNFKGGKGVASTLGLMLVMTPIVGILTIFTWLFMAITFRYSSLSALTALTLSPIYALFFSTPIVSLIYLFLTILSFYQHRANIKRLIHKEETKIKLGKSL